MNLALLTPLIITTAVAVLGWIVAHRLTSKRDLANKRRELKIKYLIDAYRQLESAANRSDASSKWSALESAIADIQPFGTPKQVDMAKVFAEEFADHQSASLDALLFNLRETLRTELQLEPVNARIKYLRFDPSSPAADSEVRHVSAHQDTVLSRRQNQNRERAEVFRVENGIDLTDQRIP